jgi:uncharacterized lipoprotein YddW (UPF0748 family)
MKTTTSSLALVAVALLLSSCISFGPQPVRQQTSMGSAPRTVEGTWADPNGIISTFQGGAFNTRTTDTNQVLASGTYTNTSPGLVEINMTSMVRKTQSKVNCALVNSSQLNCTSDSGAQFSLTRRS